MPKSKLENGAKLDRQFRSVSLSGIKAVAENNVVKNVSVSSEEPYSRWYGTEILSHAPGAIDLKRVTANAAPLLFNHDVNQVLGKINNPHVTGGKLYVDLRFSTNDLAQQILKDLQDEIISEMSVGYEVHKFEVDEDEETYTATLWEIYEASAVSVPADFTVGVGRSNEEGSPVEIATRKKEVDTNPNPPENKRKQSTMADETPEQKAAREQREKDSQAANRKAVSDGIKSARDRETEIRAIAARGEGIPDEVLQRAIEDAVENSGAVESFRKLVFEKYLAKAKPLDTPNEDDPRSTTKPQSGTKSSGLTVGAAFVQSKDFQERGHRTGQRRSVAMEFPDVTMLGIRGKLALARRAFASGDLSAVNIQVLPQMITLGVQRLTIMDMLAPGTTNAAALPYPKENSFGTIGGVAVGAGAFPRGQAVGERGSKPLWEPDLTTDVANVKKIAVITKVPDEFMADFPAAQSYIDERLPYMVDLETEFQLLYGDGNGNNIKGIFTNAGVQTRAVDGTSDTTVAASLKKGLTDVSVNSQFEPTGYAFHPYDWETASLLKDTAGRFLAGGPFYVPYGNGVFMEMMTFWGKPVVVTTSVAYGRPLAGAWKLGAQYFVREGMRLEMTNSDVDDFERNLIALRAEHRLALATYRPIAFIEFTGFPARV